MGLPPLFGISIQKMDPWFCNFLSSDFIVFILMIGA